jgi:hypothetical protein
MSYISPEEYPKINNISGGMIGIRARFECEPLRIIAFYLSIWDTGLV